MAVTQHAPSTVETTVADPLTRMPRPFGVLLLVLAGALLANTVLGPLGTGLVTYPISETLRNQLIGLEIVTLALVVPWTVFAGVASLRGRSGGPLLAFGPAAYTAYMFVQYVLGPEYAEYRLVVIFHLGILILSGGVTLWAWSLSREEILLSSSRRRELAYGGVLLGLAVFVLSRYLAAIAGSFTGAAIAPEFEAERTFYWSIFLLDLGIVVPCTVAGAIALIHGAPLGRRALYAATGWFALVPPSVAAMAAVMLVNDDAHASVGTVVLLGSASVAFVLFTAMVYRPLWQRADAPAGAS
jgi:hypothetical protein